jgi:hypothetical protein
MNRHILAAITARVTDIVRTLPESKFRMPCERCDSIRHLVVGTGLCRPCVHGAVLSDHIVTATRLERSGDLAANVRAA